MNIFEFVWFCWINAINIWTVECLKQTKGHKMGPQSGRTDLSIFFKKKKLVPMAGGRPRVGKKILVQKKKVDDTNGWWPPRDRPMRFVSNNLIVPEGWPPLWDRPEPVPLFFFSWWKCFKWGRNVHHQSVSMGPSAKWPANNGLDIVSFFSATEMAAATVLECQQPPQRTGNIHLELISGLHKVGTCAGQGAARSSSPDILTGP